MKLLKKVLKGMSFLAVVSVIGLTASPTLKSAVFPPVDDSNVIAKAYQNRQSNLLIETEATVLRVYPDVEDHVKYQEFSVLLSNGHRLRIQHSLDEANRVPVSSNTVIRVRGEYDWTRDGGVIHWTHDDPSGKREGGWIEVQGQRFL